MGKYKTTKCGHCKHYWEILAPAGSAVVGPPIIKCRNCNGLNRTSRNLYRDVKVSQKIYFWAGTLISSIIFGIGGIAGGIGLISNKDKSGTLGIIMGSFFLIFGVLNFYILYKTKDGLKVMEDDFDKNGGFLWSDEE